MKINYPIKLVIAFFALLVVSLWNKIGNSSNQIVWLNSIQLCIAVLTLFAGNRIAKLLQVSQARFNAIFFGFMFFKMIITLFLICIYLIMNKINLKVGTIFIVCSYFIYTYFEIQFILAKLRTDYEKKQNVSDAYK